MNNENNENSFLKKINILTAHHYNNSIEYKKIIDKIYLKKYKVMKIVDVPFLPVNIFKQIEIKSISENQIYKVIYSSGTSSSGLSKIFLDKLNAKSQTIALIKLVSRILGSKRLPMLIIDEEESIKNPLNFNAKTAAYLGFSIFGNNKTYLIKNKEIDYENINNFLSKHSSKPFFIFGFTYKVYLNLIKKINLKKLMIKNLTNGVLIHGGGWKKMENEKVSNEKFKAFLKKNYNLKQIYNYYGLIEQIGSIFLESQKCGYFTTNDYSEIIIRDKNFKALPDGKKGFIQILSLLPTSYPGHSLLTEDIGKIISIKNCKCGKNQKHFKIYGRVIESELRGCSDV